MESNINPRNPNSGRPPGPLARSWKLKKQALIRELLEVEARSPVLKIEAIRDLGEEIRAVVVFLLKTVVTPLCGELRTDGPVITGIRYHQSFIRCSPPSMGIVTILAPEDVFHPNIGKGGGLCLGHPPAGISMESILCSSYLGLILSSHSTVEWRGLHPGAAHFVRSNAQKFPLLPTGMYEEPPAHLKVAYPGKESSLPAGGKP